MTAYEIISIFIGILALLMSFGSLIVALLSTEWKILVRSHRKRERNGFMHRRKMYMDVDDVCAILGVSKTYAYGITDMGTDKGSGSGLCR